MDRDVVSRSEASDFKLGDWWVRPQRNLLEQTGRTVHVEPRSMEVLVCLADHAPAMVTKGRLLEEVWHGAFVGDAVISHAVWELRKALGDSPRSPAYIRTVPRKGYELVAEVLRPQGSPLPMEGVRIDRYDLQEELGRGSMGVVYKTLDRRLGREVAIKFIASERTRDPEACRRFEREAKIAASLDHPNLATVHEVGETSQGHRYLVTAYYSGGNLKQRLAEGPLEVPEALRLARQLLAGLDVAHGRGIVHRDVKPANLLLDEHGTLKICDFGIAKLLGATDLTRTGAPLGTPAYKSPEQARGRAVDQRTDLWSAGVVLFELLTGRRPFDGGIEHAVVHSILANEPQALSDADGRPLPEPLRRFVARALAKDPEGRFQSAEEMAAALDRLDVELRYPPPAGRSRRWTAAAAGLAVVLVLVLAVLGTLSVRQGSPPPPVAAGPGQGWDHVAQGRSLWLRGNHRSNLREVRGHFEKAAELLPDSAEALGHLAAFLAESYASSNRTRTQDRDAARELIRQALAADPRAPLARAAEAWILLMEGELLEGERLTREAREIEPECARGESCDLAYLWPGEAPGMQGRADEAFAVLEEGTRVGGGHIRCRLKRAQLYEKTGEGRKAEDGYLQVLELDQTQTTALNDLAVFYQEAQRDAEAVPLLRRFYQATGDPSALNNIGNAFYQRELWEEAIETYREAHLAFEAAGAKVPTPLVNIGDVYLELGQRTEGREYFRQALAIFDSMDRPGIVRQAQRAVCLAKLGRFDEAEAEVRRILSQDQRIEDTPDLLAYAARVYALQGDRETLLELARRWAGLGRESARFRDDSAFIPYRKDREYLRILEPQLIPAG